MWGGTPLSRHCFPGAAGGPVRGAGPEAAATQTAQVAGAAAGCPALVEEGA